MLITKDFVVLNLPKTGSSFVRETVKELFQRRKKGLYNRLLQIFGYKVNDCEEIMTQHPTFPNIKDQHGCFDLIPSEHKTKKILSVIRDPYERLESSYKYRAWAKKGILDQEIIDHYFPNFPNLTFLDFLELRKLRHDLNKEKYGIKKNLKIGGQSLEFIRFFFRDHQQVLANISDEYIASCKFLNDLCNITLLRNETLNVELASFLLGNGFSKKEANIALKHQRVNVTKSNISESLINKDLIRQINDEEWMLFHILDTLGIDYKRSDL